MSVLIKGMEKPEHCGYCRFRYDGICHALQKTQYSMNECPLVVIDDAGLNDTISRQAAIDAMKSISDSICEQQAIDALCELPSAQPERKKGEWIDMGDFEQCSVCLGTRLKEFQTFYGKAIWIKTDFCPNCGARMEESEVNE